VPGWGLTVAERGWAPVVYGRTPFADTWWRVVPSGSYPRAWLSGVVQAAVAGGAELRGRPRFVLAQAEGHRLVGVACLAADLSASMHSDGSGELHCFVGWLASGGPGGPPRGPTCARLRDDYRRWAGAVYEHWVGPVWKAPAHALRRPRAARAGEAPWQTLSTAAPLTVADDWERLWDLANTSTQPMTVVLGWASPQARRPVSSARAVGLAWPSSNAPPRPPDAVRPAGWLGPTLASGAGLFAGLVGAALVMGLAGDDLDPRPTGVGPGVVSPSSAATTSLFSLRDGQSLLISTGPPRTGAGGEVTYLDPNLVAAEGTVLRQVTDPRAPHQACRDRPTGTAPARGLRAGPDASFCVTTIGRARALIKVISRQAGWLQVEVISWPARPPGP
jgi:hypothetical protein